EGFLADFREVSPFVDHTAELAPHADRTGLAGVLRCRRPPEGAETDPPGQPQAVENRLPATAGFGRSNHERIPWESGLHDKRIDRFPERAPPFVRGPPQLQAFSECRPGTVPASLAS